MKKIIKFVALMCLLVAPMASVVAADLSKQKPIELNVALGDKNNAMIFSPSLIELEAGKLYKLVLENKGHTKHYFTSPGLAQAVYTRKVQINDADGKPMAEVKGSINEIEIYPGHKAEWWFVPVKAGEFGDLHCSIAGHTEAGMVGKVIIK